MLNFRPKSIDEPDEKPTTMKKTQWKQHHINTPRHRSNEHENPTDDITLNAPMLQPIPHEDVTLWLPPSQHEWKVEDMPQWVIQSETKTYVGTNSPTHKERKTAISILLLHGYLTTLNSNQLRITNSNNQTNTLWEKASTIHLLTFKILFYPSTNPPLTFDNNNCY